MIVLLFPIIWYVCIVAKGFVEDSSQVHVYKVIFRFLFFFSLWKLSLGEQRSRSICYYKFLDFCQQKIGSFRSLLGLVASQVLWMFPWLCCNTNSAAVPSKNGPSCALPHALFYSVSETKFCKVFLLSSQTMHVDKCMKELKKLNFKMVCSSCTLSVFCILLSSSSTYPGICGLKQKQKKLPEIVTVSSL